MNLKNSPETAFSRDVLGRFVCNSWEEAVANPEGIDVVVLGGGMYGGYAAAKLYELSKARGLGLGGLRVLVLDAGPFLLPGHAENIPSLGLFAPQPRSCSSGANPEPNNEVWGIGWRSFEPFVGSAYCVGGKGLFWGGWCPRLQPQDLELWPKEVKDFFTLQQSVLPTRPLDHTETISQVSFKKDDLLSGYEALEYEIGVKPSDDFVFDPTDAQNERKSLVGLNEAFFGLCKTVGVQVNGFVEVTVAPIAVQTQSYVSGLFSLDKYSSVPAIIGAARSDHTNSPPNRIAVVPYTHVVGLEFAPSAEAPQRGTRVVQAIVVHSGGEQKRLNIAPHCQVILALGCIESTRLALESFSREGSGLAPNGELMGRNYMIHYREDFEFSVSRDKLADWVKETWKQDKKTLNSLLQQSALHLQFDTPNGRVHYQLYAAQGGNADKLYKMIPDLDVQRQFVKNSDSEKISLILRGIAEQLGDAPQIKKDPVGSLRKHDPKFGFINLAGMGDFDSQFGHRRAWVQFPLGADRAPIWGDMFDKAKEISQQIKRVLKEDDNDFVPKGHQGLGTTYHDSGTLWMGDNPETSVTDVNGHFHHVTNAYCIDQSVFPTVGSANPVLTGLVMARKTVEDILSKHVSHSPASIPPGFVNIDLKNGWDSHPYEGFNKKIPNIIETEPTSQGLGLYYLPMLRTDWEVIIEWKAMREGNVVPNAGILFRLPDPKAINFSNESAVKSYFSQAIEIQIDETGKNYRGLDVSPNEATAIFGDSRYKTGAVYGLASASQWAAKFLAPFNSDSYWNEFRIRVLGDQVNVQLNGKLVCDTVVPPELVHPGYFGLQFHTGKVQFRNLRIN